MNWFKSLAAASALLALAPLPTVRAQEAKPFSTSNEVVGDAARSDNGCPSGMDIRTSDLCAQWKAADAAAASVLWTMRSVYVALMGMIVAVLTLFAAVAAALYARTAARYAKDANDISAKEYHQKIAPVIYYYSGNIEVWHDGRILNIKHNSTLRNYGNSPAVLDHSQTTTHLIFDGVGSGGGSGWDAGLVIGPGQEYDVISQIGLQAPLSEFSGKFLTFYIAIRVRSVLPDGKKIDIFWAGVSVKIDEAGSASAKLRQQNPPLKPDGTPYHDHGEPEGEEVFGDGAYAPLISKS